MEPVQLCGSATSGFAGSKVTITGDLPDTDLPTDRGVLAPVELLLSRYRAPRLPDLPPLTAGLVGYLGYEVGREVEHLRTCRRMTAGIPTPCSTSSAI